MFALLLDRLRPFILIGLAVIFVASFSAGAGGAILMVTALLLVVCFWQSHLIRQIVDELVELRAAAQARGPEPEFLQAELDEREQPAPSVPLLGGRAASGRRRG